MPIANATSCARVWRSWLKAEMVVYKGFGHGINKRRAMRAGCSITLTGSITTYGATGF